MVRLLNRLDYSMGTAAPSRHGVVDLGARVAGVQHEAQARLAHGHGRELDRVDMDALRAQRALEVLAAPGVADQYRHDRGGVDVSW